MASRHCGKQFLHIVFHIMTNTRSCARVRLDFAKQKKGKSKQAKQRSKKQRGMNRTDGDGKKPEKQTNQKTNKTRNKK